MSDRDDRVKSLFLEAVEGHSPAEWPAFLERACGGDAELRADIERLLRARSELGSFHEPPRPPLAQTSDNPTNELSGTVIGPYKLIQEIGEGGMGAVWMAQQTGPIKRLVALKVIKPGMDSRQVIARFEAERQALALMDHPNIARVFDAGMTTTGRPYFVMELVKGVPITKYCDERRLTPKERLELFVPVCQAIQHAHQKGIIHRDIKPSNVLVALYDGKPVPKVIDFGVAKATGQSLTDHTLVTGFGAVVGTLQYMSPEQAGLNQLDIDTRSDVYSLGVLLYELLTGSTPLDKKRLTDAAMLEVLRLIREEEPQKPSTRLSSTAEMPSVAAHRGLEPKKLSGLVRGELDWIVMKALAKERERRYETANGFALDVQRYLADEPVQAGPPSATYRLRKFVRRNRSRVAAAFLVLLALVAGIVGTTVGLVRAEHRRVEAEGARADEAEQRGVAEANAARALVAAAAEKVAKEHEADQRKKAEKARDRTMDALDAMTSKIGWDSLRLQIEVGAEQKKFLSSVLDYYEEFAREKADDEKSLRRAAEAAHRVAHIESSLGRNPEAVAAFRRACERYARLAEEFPATPEYRNALADNHLFLVMHLKLLGKWPEAEEQYRLARAVWEKLAADFPAEPNHRQRLAELYLYVGSLLPARGKWREAEEQFRLALAVWEKLAIEYPTIPRYRDQLARSHTGMGGLLRDLGKEPEAEQQFRKALALQEKLAADFPSTLMYRYSLAASHTDLGRLLSGWRKWAEAEEQFRKALAIQERLAADFSVFRFRPELANSHTELGSVLNALGKLSEAEQQYRIALIIRDDLAIDFPFTLFRSNLAASHTDMGRLLSGWRKWAEAEEQFRKALAIRVKLAADFPTVAADADYRVDLGGSYCDLGILVRDGGRLADSLAWFQKAIDTLRPIHEKEPGDVKAKQFLRNSYRGRAVALDRLERSPNAEKDWDRLAELSDKEEQLGIRASRAASKVQAGKVAEAVAEVAELTKSPNLNAVQLYDFACVYALASGKSADRKAEYADRAMELLQKAVKTGYKDASHMREDTDLDGIRGREDFKALIAAIEKKAAAKPAKQP